MSAKRIQRKHFLAGLGAAVAGVFGGSKLSAKDVSSPSVQASRPALPIPARDERAVARSTHG